MCRGPRSDIPRTPRRNRDRSGLRHDGRSGEKPASPRLPRARPIHFCGARLPHQIRRRSAKNISTSATAAAPRPRRRARSTPARCIPQIRQVGPGTCPICGMALEPRGRRRRRRRRTRRHDAPVLDFAGAGAAGLRRCDMGGHFGLVASRAGGISTLVAIRAGDAGRAVGRLAVLRARRAVAASRGNLNMFTLIALGTGVGLCLQRRRDARRRACSRRRFATAWRRRGLLRSRRRHHRAGAARPGAGAARPRLDLRRDPRAARARAEDRAPRRGRRQRRGRAARRGRRRRSAARAARRKSAGRRRRHRRQIRGRRIDGHRRIDAGRQSSRRQA